MIEQPVTLGVISDTHMPKRCKRLPDAVFDVLAGVDVVVHAGDVGELWVIDQLSRIAPVVAVHGNDETDEAVSTLPYLLVLNFGGHRIVLSHGHFLDPVVEARQRADDNWYSSFERWTARAREHQAGVVIYGHSHIPTCAIHDGVWLVNPGAIAPPNVTLRQTVQTVARMTLAPGQPPQVTHIDLATGEVHQPPDDFDAGFFDFFARYTASILMPDLRAESRWIREELLSEFGPERVSDPLLPLAHACWDGEREFVTTAEAVAAWLAQPDLPPELPTKLRENPAFAPFVSE